jgi:hypothetical protein
VYLGCAFALFYYTCDYIYKKRKKKERDCDNVLIPHCAYVNSCCWEEWRHKFLPVFHVERLKEKIGSKVTCAHEVMY